MLRADTDTDDDVDDVNDDDDEEEDADDDILIEDGKKRPGREVLIYSIKSIVN